MREDRIQVGMDSAMQSLGRLGNPNKRQNISNYERLNSLLHKQTNPGAQTSGFETLPKISPRTMHGN